MINIKVTYNGKTYNKIEDAFGDAIDSGIKKAIINSVMDKLTPCQPELDNCGGWLEFIFEKEGYNADINFHDIPSELSSKMKELLS